MRAITWEGVLIRDPQYPARFVVRTKGRLIPVHAGDPLAVQIGGTWVPGRVEHRGPRGWVWIGQTGTWSLADGLRVRLGVEP